MYFKENIKLDKDSKYLIEEEETEQWMDMVFNIFSNFNIQKHNLIKHE